MFNSIKEDKRAELLKSIVSQNSTNLDEQLYFALKSTCELLGLEIGIISRIHGDTYSIDYFFPEGVGLFKGQQFELGNTYCSITLSSHGAFSIPYMGESEYNMHPCYEAFHLESYIGIPFSVNDKIYGTVNFSSSRPKEDGFTKADSDMMTLLGQWVGSIIQRKQMEDELEHEKELYRLLSTNSAELICLHNPDGTFKFVSDSSIFILGYLPEELVGKTPFHFIHPGDLRRSAIPQYRKALSGIPVTNTEFRMKRKDGEYIWMNTSAEPILSDTGEILSLQSTTRDISEKKRLEILFNESQSMANVGGWEYDLKTGKLYWTDEVYRIHDIPIGTEVFVEEGISFFPLESREKLEQAIAHTISTGELYDLELEFISAKDTRKWVRAIGRAEIANGEAYKLHGTFQDITERKKNRDQIAIQRDKIAQEKQSKEKLYSILSHDLTNSLFGISGFLDVVITQLQEKDTSVDEIIDHLKLLQNSSEGALNLLKTVQNWVKMQAGYLESVPKQFDVVPELEKVKSIYHTSLVNKGIMLNINIPDMDSIPVFSDQEMVSTIMRNVFNNAIKYSDTDGRIDIRVIKNESDSVRIVFRDYGIGMPKEVRDKLFSFSSRPQRAGTEDEPGTGLGMLLCKELAEHISASFIIRSSEGIGTEISLEIPADPDIKLDNIIDVTELI